MKNEILFIDGYNIINSWDELKIQSEISLESAREKLIDIIANYQGFTDIETIIVFDGYNVKRSTENKMNYKTISVIFTKEGQTADNYIENRPPKKNMLADNLDEEMRIWLENMRLGKK